MRKSLIKKTMPIVLTAAMLGTMVTGMSPLSVSANAGTNIVDLTVNYQTEPLGIETDTPGFGWRMESDAIGKKQSAYRIIVSRDENGKDVVWDSGKVESEYSVGIAYGGAELEQATRYYWTVTVWDERGVSYSTQPSYFETGVTEDEEWINTPFIQVNRSSNSAPIFRTEGDVDGTVTNARLYVTAAGVYDAYINGRKTSVHDCGKETYYHMAPGYGNGKHSIGYQTYDVTSYFADNEAFALAIQAGTGWSNINGGEILHITESQPAIKAMLRIEYTNAEGEEKLISVKTNTSDWKATLEGPITASGIFYGEDYDARKKEALGEYKNPGYDDSGWTEELITAEYVGSIIADRASAGKIIDQFEQKPVSVVTYTGNATSSSYSGGEIAVDDYFAHELPEDELYKNKYNNIPADKEIFEDGISLRAGQTMVVNMGQNITAVPEICFKGTSGGTVTMKFGEILNDGSSVGSGVTQADGPKGSMYKKSLRAARAEARYTFAGNEEEVYQPQTSFFGYQYIEITTTCDTVIYSLRSRAVSSVSEQSGNIETNNADVNRLFKNALFGQLSNSFTTLTDCPQRDERRAWTGDAQVFAQTAVYNFDAMAFMNGYQENLTEITMIQGYPGAVVALWDWFNHWATGWSDVQIINPWVLYNQTGDKSVLSDNWKAMKRYMAFLQTYERAEYCAPNAQRNCIGDWLAFQGTGYEVIADCYYGYVTSLMAKMADILGDTEQAEYYRDYFEKQKQAFLKNHVEWNTDDELEDVEIIEAPTKAEAGVSNIITNSFADTDARYVKLTVSKTGPGAADYNEYHLQMMELAVSGNDGENYALNKTVDASSNFNYPSDSDPSIWGAIHLTDGNPDVGYSSTKNSSTDLSSNPISVTVDLEEIKSINKIDITCRMDVDSMEEGICANYPRQYTISVSEDGETWTQVGSYATEKLQEKMVVKSGTGTGVMLNRGGVYENNSQTALLWMLKLGYYDSEEMRDETIRLLVENIKNENPVPGSVREDYGKNTLAVGFLGSNVITPVLTDIGRSDVSYDLLLNDEMPSWLFEVKAGATTIWERWNSYSPGIGFGDSDMNSFNHFAYGSVAEWMYRYMAGISSDEAEAGFKHIILQPTIDTGEQYNSEERINHVSGSYDSYYGMIKSEWNSEDGVLTSYHAEIPANTTATLYLPVPEEIDGMDDADGLTFNGITERNGHRVAEITMESGGYSFDISDGVIKASVDSGYTEDDGMSIGNISYNDNMVCFNVYNGADTDYNYYVAEYNSDNALVGATVLKVETSSSEEKIEIPYSMEDTQNRLRLFVWSDGQEPIMMPFDASSYIPGPSATQAPEKTATYKFVDDAIKSSGGAGAGEVFEWVISSTPQYFYFDTIDFDAVESITIRSGYQSGSAVTAVYAYDSNGEAINEEKLKEFCSDPSPLGEPVGTIADAKNAAWGYRTGVISKDGVSITEGTQYNLLDASKKLDIAEGTGKKALIIGITGAIGRSAYFDGITVTYK